MSGLTLIEISLLVLLVLCSGFFSGSETSLFALGRIERYRIREEKGTVVSRSLRFLIDRPRRLIVTILIGNEILNITISAMGASLTDRALSAWIVVDFLDPVILKTLAATAICFPLLLVFGEITPKTLALYNPRRFARFAAVPLRLFYTVITPVRGLLAGLSNGIVRFVLGESPLGDSPITEEEFRSLVDMSKKGGVLWESEREFIHNIFEFEETPVSEVMTPRTDMFCLQVDQSLEETLKFIEEKTYSRIPVYGMDKDDIVGILYCKDLLGISSHQAKREGWNLRESLRKPYFIPETKKASELFREFRFNRIHMAIVVDEYGGVAGLVTMEDLLEELFGEIVDEYDPEEPQLRELDERTVIIPGKMPIEEFNRRAGADLPVEEYDTMGGLVFGLFGRLPVAGAKVSYLRHTFTVERMLGTRIVELRIERQPEEPAGVEAEEDESRPLANERGGD